MSNRIIQLITVALLLLASTLISVTLIHRSVPGSSQSLAFALLPVPFFVLAFVWIFRNARSCDEMQQRIQFEALVVAFPLSMILAITVQLLHTAGMTVRFTFADLVIDMDLFYLAGLYLSWRRYR